MRRHNSPTRPKFLPALLLIIPTIISPCCSSFCCTTLFVVTPLPIQLRSTSSSLPRHCGQIPLSSSSSSSSTTITSRRWRRTRRHQRPTITLQIKSKDRDENDNTDHDDDEQHETKNNYEETIIADDADSTLPIDLFSGDISEKKVPSLTSQVTLGFFKFFSYCLQFVGFFFFCGLLLNFAGYGYTFNFEHGLVVDKIQNIRNEIQFEMEIEREEMEDLRGGLNTGGSNALRITPEKNAF